jgi:hypothetical protein
LNANKRIDMIMVMARNNNNNNNISVPASTTNKSLNIQTNFQSSSSNLTTFEGQVDCSRVVDLYGGAQIVRN